MSYFRVNERCNGCLACVQNCPAKALDHRDEGAFRTIVHNMARCARCATCWRVCPQKAVAFEHILENRWDDVTTLPLVRCTVCGEPLHGANLPASLDAKVLGMVEALCDRHRGTRAAERLRPGKEAAR